MSVPETPPYSLFSLCKSQPYPSSPAFPWLQPTSSLVSPVPSFQTPEGWAFKFVQSEQRWTPQPGGCGPDSGLLINSLVLPSAPGALKGFSLQSWRQISPAAQGMESSLQLAFGAAPQLAWGRQWDRAYIGLFHSSDPLLPCQHRLAQAATCRMKDPRTMVPSRLQEC